MAKYSREKLWELYKELPDELKRVIFSEKTADYIRQICYDKAGLLKSEKTIQVAENTGYVLMGLLPPTEFKETLIKEVGLKEEEAKIVFSGINDFIFFPVKELLEKMYDEKIEKTGFSFSLKEKPKGEEEEEKEEETKPNNREENKEGGGKKDKNENKDKNNNSNIEGNINNKKIQDAYREPIN